MMSTDPQHDDLEAELLKAQAEFDAELKAQAPVPAEGEEAAAAETSGPAETPGPSDAAPEGLLGPNFEESFGMLSHEGEAGPEEAQAEGAAEEGKEGKEEEEEEEEKEKKPSRWAPLVKLFDLTTCMLGIALLALLLGTFFMYVELRRYNFDTRAKGAKSHGALPAASQRIVPAEGPMIVLGMPAQWRDQL
jgi:hypothetical protein